MTGSESTDGDGPPKHGWPALTDWVEEPRGLIKSTMKRQKLTYDDLALKLKQIGIGESAANLRNKINRGNFSASFFLQCLTALEVSITRMGRSREWVALSQRFDIQPVETPVHYGGSEGAQPLKPHAERKHEDEA